MKNCRTCHNDSVKRKHILSSRFLCHSCGAEYSLTSTHKAVVGLLFGVLPLVGVVAVIFSKSGVMFFLLAIVMPIAVCWWYEESVELELRRHSRAGGNP